MRKAGYVGAASWPYTRIRRRGIVAGQNLRKRAFFKGAANYLAIFLAFALAYVWTRVQVLETGYVLRNLEMEKQRLKEENRSLLVEAATLRSPQRLEKIARTLDLERPTEQQVYFVNTKIANE